MRKRPQDTADRTVGHSPSLFDADVEVALPFDQIQTLAEQLLDEVYQRFPIASCPLIEWRKYRTTAGTAHFFERKIALSALILTTEERLRTTLLHEYAHLLAFHRHGKRGRGHGPAWRQAMADLGLPPEVHHRLDCKRNQSQQVVLYRCARCHEIFERRRRMPARRRYIHINCGGAIQFVGVSRHEEAQ